MKSRRKALKSLVGEKIVNISDYRSMRNGRTSRKLAIVTDKRELSEGLSEQLKNRAEVQTFDSRFALEQALKNGEWDGVVLDERLLREEAAGLCEKIKKNQKLEDVFVVILSDRSDKETVRIGYEKGCDEWITKADDLTHLSRLMSHHLSS